MKKGFTLIELLAVIVILAILALIVSPIISGVISDAKKASAERSTEGYIKAVEYAQVQYQYKNGGSITTDINKLSISAQGIDRVTVTSMEFNNSGIVTNATITIDEYTCNYSSGKAVCSKESIQLLVADVNPTTHVINNTWEELKAISLQIVSDNSITSASTKAQGLTIGDTKDFTIGTETVTAVVAGFNHDSDNDETGITFIIKNCLNTLYEINQIYTDEGGYLNSHMRNTVLTDVWNQMPANLKTVIKKVTKFTDSGYSDQTLKSTHDNIWLLSYDEVGFLNDEYSLSGQGIQYPIFTDDTSRIKTCNGSECIWWLRSTIETSSSHYFWNVNSDGSSYFSFSDDVNGVVFGFCI